MDDNIVKNAASFKHFYGVNENKYIEWKTLKAGEEITYDELSHPENAQSI